MRQDSRLAIAAALAEQDAKRQAGHTRKDVNDEAACEVERAELGEEAAAPDPVSHRVVDEDGPEQDEQGEAGELHALSESTGDQCRRDDGEHALEGHESQLRNRTAFQDVHANASQADFIEGTDETVDICTEGHGIAEDNPLH